jgi:hypothetical protein
MKAKTLSFFLLFILAIALSGCTRSIEIKSILREGGDAPNCAWSSIAGSYNDICSGSISNDGTVSVSRSGLPTDATLMYAAALPCKITEQRVFCSGVLKQCTIISAHAPFKAKCPQVGDQMAVELRFGASLGAESKCFKRYASQPSNMCWFGTATVFKR